MSWWALSVAVMLVLFAGGPYDVVDKRAARLVLIYGESFLSSPFRDELEPLRRGIEVLRNLSQFSERRRVFIFISSVKDNDSPRSVVTDEKHVLSFF